MVTLVVALVWAIQRVLPSNLAQRRGLKDRCASPNYGLWLPYFPSKFTSSTMFSFAIAGGRRTFPTAGEPICPTEISVAWVFPASISPVRRS